MLDLDFYQLTHPGRQRAGNEDYLGHFAPKSPEEVRSFGWLFALADGVGGQDRGEVASRLAVESLLAGFSLTSKDDALGSILPKLMQASNACVYEAATSGVDASNMATTMVACALRYDRAIIAHAGDSRCYLIRQGYATSLTRDHTLANEQFRMGLLNSGEAAQSRIKHVLSRSLGSSMFVNAEVSEQQIFSGDLLLQCSDGLHHSLTTEDIAAAVNTQTSLRESAQTLVDLANERDGSDNISVQIIRVKSVEQVGLYRGRHYKLH